MTRPRRPPRTPRARRSYDPLPLWESHHVGSYAPPDSLAGAAYDLNPLINWPDALHALLWAAWRILAHRDGVRTIHIPANGSYSVNEVRAEWRRLHVASCVLSMSNGGMTILVGARQERWARYVVGRMLAGESVPAWGESPSHFQP